MLFFNFGGDLPLMDFNLWWSFPSGGAILHTASAYTVVEVFLLLLLLCSPCPLWWSVGYWHRPVHTATQLNRLSTDLLATSPRVRSPLTTIFGLSSTSSIFREEEVKLSSDWLQTQAWSAQWRGDHQDKKHCHHQHKKKKEHSH